MAYLNSENVNVFPCANRSSTYNNDARLLSEHAISNIVNQLINNNAFVITDSFNSGKSFEFNIYGYYFYISDGNHITSAAAGSSDTPYICAKINIGSSTYAYSLYNIDTGSVDNGDLDTDSQFLGLDITAYSSMPSNDTTNGIYYLCLLKYDSTKNSYEIPANSKVAFTTDRLGLDYNNAIESGLYDNRGEPEKNNATIGLHNVYITLDDGYLS